MSVLTGYGKYKRYTLTDDGYKLCSQWTNSNTIEFDDGKTAQIKLGAINGITSSLVSTSKNIALSAAAGKDLQDQVTELNTSLETLGESVADGKTSIASAITAKGVNTNSNANFSTMAENIANIKTGGSATLISKTYTTKQGIGSCSTSTSYSIADGGTYLIVANGEEINENFFYDSITVTLKSGGTSVGTTLNIFTQSAYTDGGQGSIKHSNLYYIAKGNQTISFTVNGKSFSTYALAVYAELLVFRI
ncbi:MAG: hypothetical protein NC541_08495 [bacterium]|nr:hypothetical protein [bacterium]